MLTIRKHRQVLFNLITTIYKQLWSVCLGLKGGTMAYFFYGLDRFSVDLDFDLLEEEKLPLVKNTLPGILAEHGEIRDFKDKRFTLFYLLNYQRGERNIKVEISKRKTLPVDYKLANFYGLDVKIMKIEDAFATKILACLTRKNIAYRDFYDLCFYLTKGIQPNDKVIKAGLGKDLKTTLRELINLVENKVTNRNVVNAIGELIDKEKKQWVSKNFQEELLRKLKFFREQIL